MSTICADCKHHRFNGPIWYDQFCVARQRPPVQDVVTGKWGYGRVNSLGMGYVSEQKFEYCRDVNDGNCQWYINGAGTTNFLRKFLGDKRGEG